MGRVGDLEVDQDIAFERRAWVAQRVGWLLMTLVVVAALAGLLGPGPYSWATAETADGGLVAEYSRFVRADADANLEVSVGRRAVRDGRIRLWVDRRYLAGARLEKVVPEPEAVEATADRLVYVFAAGPGATGARLSFDILPQKMGPWPARLGVDGGPELAFRQFVFP